MKLRTCHKKIELLENLEYNERITWFTIDYKFCVNN